MSNEQSEDKGKKEERELEEREQREQEEREQKEQIIVAEDSAPNRNILVHLLTKLGYNVKSFEDGQSAWEYVDNEKPEKLVAIISDIMMPNMDGLEFLKNVRENSYCKDIPFVFYYPTPSRLYRQL